ncbi:hypothetical protein N0V95_005410 [Ascochyta clinopodiicola]|nr:hypothetical protein N0V95_005410 [Ascochyta clinopodiicola]
MRFLVVSSSRFEMILGSDTITRHSLLLPPCFQAGGNGVVNERAEDEKLLDPKIKHGKMLSKIENDKKFLEDQHKKKESQRDKSEIERCEGRLPQQQHELKVLEHELAAAKLKSKGKTSEARREEQLAQDEKDAWNAAQAPKKSTCSAPVAAVDGKKVSARPPTKRGSGHSK